MNSADAHTIDYDAMVNAQAEALLSTAATYLKPDDVPFLRTAFEFARDGEGW